MLTFLFSPLIALVGALVGGALAWWSYWRTAPPLAAGPRAALTLMRTLTFALLAFLLAGPILRRVASTPRPATVAVVLDRSASMALHAGTATLPARLDAFAATLKRDDGADLGVARFAFDRTARSVNRFDSAVARFDGPRTDVARALDAPATRLAGRNLQGVVLVTDGRVTAGRSPLAVAERLGVPVFVVAVGDTLRRRDVAVSAVVANRRVLPGAPQPVEVRVRAVGASPGETATVTLRLNGAVVGTQTVTLPDGDGEVPVAFDYTPPASGAVRLDATVTPISGEATPANNTRSTTADVQTARRRVLLLAAAPDPDVAAFRAALDADAALDVTVRVQRAPGQFYDGPAPDPADFDVAVLLGVPGPATDDALLARMAAQPRLGLVVVAGTLTDYGRLAATLGPLLPASVSAGGEREVRVRVRDGATAHPALTGVASLDVLPSLPALRLATSGPSLSPAARVLLEGTGGEPVVVAERRGRRRAVFVAASAWWRWRQLPEAQASLGTVFPSLVSRWVAFAASDAAPDVQIQSTDTVFGDGEPVTFDAQLVGDEGAGVEDATVEVAISGPVTRTLAMRPIGAGRYALDAGALPPGTYRYTGRATRGGAVLGTDGGTFSVGSTPAETADPSADLPLLRALADATGGALLRPSDLDSLRRRLETSPAFAPSIVAGETEASLFDRWPFFAVLLVLLTAEWALRKRAGMA